MKQSKRDERAALRALIRGAGLRVTSSRIAVLSVLSDAEGPLSHAEVATHVEGLGLDRTTVYRNLVDLAEAGVLRRSDVGHTFRFELVGGREVHDGERHPHFVCTDCGKVSCLPAGSVSIKPARGAPVALRRGNLEIQLRGLCDTCS